MYYIPSFHFSIIISSASCIRKAPLIFFLFKTCSHPTICAIFVLRSEQGLLFFFLVGWADWAGRERGEGANSGTTVENSSLVSKDREDGIRHSTASKTVENPLNLTIGQSCNTSSVSKTQFDGLRLVRTKRRKKGMSLATLNIILNSWREKTRTQYNIYLSRFATFCKSNHLNPHVRD